MGPIGPPVVPAVPKSRQVHVRAGRDSDLEHRPRPNGELPDLSQSMITTIAELPMINVGKKLDTMINGVSQAVVHHHRRRHVVRHPPEMAGGAQADRHFRSSLPLGRADHRVECLRHRSGALLLGCPRRLLGLGRPLAAAPVTHLPRRAHLCSVAAVYQPVDQSGRKVHHLLLVCCPCCTGRRRPAWWLRVAWLAGLDTTSAEGWTRDLKHSPATRHLSPKHSDVIWHTIS